MRRKLVERLTSPGQRLGAMPTGPKISFVVLAVLCLAAVFAPVISPFDPLASGTPVQPPSGEHWFGTDAIGRDIFSRIIHGARPSLIIGLCATGIALLAAAVLGSIAATSPKWVSEPLMRLMDIIMSFPAIALVAVFVAVLRGQLPMIPVLVISISIPYIPQLTRVVRANVLSQFGEDYVAATRVMGARTWWILSKHVARNCIAPILVFATVLVADAIVLEASLSFINAGVSPPKPSWGNILSDGKGLVLSGYWWPTFFPGVFLLITVLCLNVLSEGMTDAMVSPAQGRAAKLGDEEVDDVEEAAADASEQDTEAIPLEERLEALAVAERARDDRLVLADVDTPPLLEFKNLSIAFPEAHGDVDIVDDVSFTVRPGETMGLVGESGCGKSITSMAVMGLLPRTARLKGEILFERRDLLTMSPKGHNALRGHKMSMIYQDALSSLNPSMLVESQLTQLTKRGGTRSGSDLLELVGLDPARVLKSYPHELSGGQRQRVLIAMALTRDPKLVIADEPTTALDVTVQKQVIDLLNRLREELGFAMLFVSHDLALVAKLAHRVTVMYAGQVVESAPTAELLTNPRHEYTRGLLGAVLSIESGQGRLHQVRGVVPSPRDFVPGDRFSPRSSNPAIGYDERAVLRDIGGEHFVALHGESLYGEKEAFR